MGFVYLSVQSFPSRVFPDLPQLLSQSRDHTTPLPSTFTLIICFIVTFRCFHLPLSSTSFTPSTNRSAPGNLHKDKVPEFASSRQATRGHTQLQAASQSWHGILKAFMLCKVGLNDQRYLYSSIRVTYTIDFQLKSQ